MSSDRVAARPRTGHTALRTEVVVQHLNGDAWLNPTLENVRDSLGHGNKAVLLEPVQETPIIGDASDPVPHAGPGAEVMAADTLQGYAVLNRQGELLGKIRDLMVDVSRGRIAYAVLSSGGVIGFGDRLYAMPWSALTLDAERRCFILDVDKARLRAAPGFDKEHWPSMADARFAKSVHDYYGVESYWN